MYARALYRPWQYYLSQVLVRKNRALHESADTYEVMYQGRKIKALPFFFRPNHLGRIKNSVFYKADQIIQEHFQREYYDLYPLRICHFSDAWLINGSLYLRGTSRMDLRTIYEKRSWINDKSLLARWPAVELSEAVLGSGVAGSSWFGHWVEDELPLQMLAKNYGRVVSHCRPLYPHEPSYLKYLALDLPRQVNSAHIRSLVVVDEFGQNPNKVRRFLDIRKSLSTGDRKYERLYLRRGKTGTLREIRNEEQLHARLVTEGFGVLELECCSFNELHEACRQANIIVGIEGSHLAHALFMAADHACLVILNPPYQTHTTVADLAPFCRLSSAMFVCTPEDESGTTFTADVEEVLAFIEDAVRFAKQHAPATDAFLTEILTLHS
jgi:Glycosyltransferase 61